MAEEWPRKEWPRDLRDDDDDDLWRDDMCADDAKDWEDTKQPGDASLLRSFAQKSLRKPALEKTEGRFLSVVRRLSFRHSKQ